MSQLNENLTGHNYDGIQEYDNPTPGWWTWLFVLSIIFGGVYFFVVTTMPSLFGTHAFYEQAVTANLMRQFAQLGDLKQDLPTLQRFVTNPEDSKWLSAGESIFRANCASCHGSGGVGISGPNLTDTFYKNIRKPEDFFAVINNGAANGAMPAWRTKLLSNEVVLVAAYVASLEGKNLPGRAPEGDELPAFFTRP